MVDHLFADFSLPDAPGASLMVIKDGAIVLARSYGLARIEDRIGCATDTNFRLASVTKQFTAMSILILATRGKLSLDDGLMRFFPNFPMYGQDIKIRHILSHTSGLMDYEDLIAPATKAQVHDKDVFDLLCKEDKLMFAPGSSFHYSNTGYAFLALIVQAASGQRFADFLHDNIFQPLGMTNTVAYEAGISTVPHRAYGYTARVDESTRRRVFAPTDQSVTSAVLGDGGIYSSTADLFKWDQALYTEKLIPQGLLQEAFTATSHPSDFQGSGYGFGWYIGTRHGVPSVWHYGSTVGFSTRIERYPARKFTLILLANRNEAPLGEISSAVTEIFWK